MAIGLVGCHRAGKTTLAATFAEQFGIPFVRTSASQVFQVLGLDPAVEYDIVTRIAVQQAILHTLVRQLEAANRAGPVFITDRTPIDLASYLLADVNRTTLQDAPAVGQLVTAYVAECLRETSRFFSMVVQVQPGIPFVEAEGKAGPCIAYQEHLNVLQAGLLQVSAVKSYMIPRSHLDLNRRVDFLKWAVNYANTSAVEDAKERHEAGMLMN